jgi:hypothetical protein
MTTNTEQTLNIKPLNSDNVHAANSHSFGGRRGLNSERSYNAYAKEITEWSVSVEKRQQLLDKLYAKWSDILRYEAQHVSVIVAGPSKYNAKKLDKGDTILRLYAEFADWYDGLKQQLEDSSRETNKADHYLRMIDFCVNHPAGINADPAPYLTGLSHYDNATFITLFEQYRDRYKWRKNSNIYKAYERSKAGEIQEIKKETRYEDDNFTAYSEGDRAYIKFLMRPKRQLIVALKSRGWWWNSRQNAWSTYPQKADWEWVKTISERYAAYI